MAMFKLQKRFVIVLFFLKRVSPKTLLTFCTNGVLLRTLMAGDSTLSTVTHVIVVRIIKFKWLIKILEYAISEHQFFFKTGCSNQVTFCFP